MQDTTILDSIVEFYEQYYREEIAELAQSYPKDTTSLHIDYQDVFSFDPDIADDLRNHPDRMLPYFEEGIEMVDLPADVDLSGVTVRVNGVNDEHTYYPGEIRAEHATQYIGVQGMLERVTTSSDLPDVIEFECKRCDTRETVPQDPAKDDIIEPYECTGCERQGPFDILHGESEFKDYAKLRIESRPDVAENQSGKITGYVIDDLLDAGGEAGLIGRAGEPVTVYGILERVQKTGRNENNLLFDHLLHVKGIEFVRDDETVEVAAHREAFEELASQPDAVDQFAESIAPQLHETDAWSSAMEFAVAYLFGAPRIDLPEGPTYRGDLHFLILSDYGMGKSTFKKEIELYSPKCVSKSTTALSSGVGLTAAAVKDDFGEGQWTIKPGLLVRANGGHLILDEIDKGPDELTEMNDALEGQQVVDIEKAGKSATYDSKTGLLALGNPVDGRFDPYDSISEQLGISETLLSRFDGIVTMQDDVNEEQDQKIAETFGKAYTEAQQAEHGQRDELVALERNVPIDTGKAWVKFARENVTPIMQYEQFQELEEWYATEVRQLNKDFAEDGQGADMPVPATVRQLGAVVKMSIAFARARLQDKVQEAQIKRAKRLGKQLIKQNWNGQEFDVMKNVGKSQKDRRQRLYQLLSEEKLSFEEIQERTGTAKNVLENDLEKLKQKGEVYEPENGVYKAT